VGEQVDEFAAGDAVVPTFLGQCSECVDCRSARSNMCSKYRFAVRRAPGDAARRHHPVHRRPGAPAAPLLRRVQLRRVHRGGREPGRQAQPRRAAGTRLPAQLRRLHGFVCLYATVQVQLRFRMVMIFNSGPRKPQGSEPHGSRRKLSLDLRSLSSASAL
jgi:hypothetical protein